MSRRGVGGDATTRSGGFVVALLLGVSFVAAFAVIAVARLGVARIALPSSESATLAEASPIDLVATAPARLAPAEETGRRELLGRTDVSYPPVPERPFEPMDARAPAELVGILRGSSDSWRRADALDALITSRSQEGVPAMLESLSDPEREIRRSAADALAELGDPIAIAALRTALTKERDAEVRDEIAKAIDELRPR